MERSYIKPILIPLIILVVVSFFFLTGPIHEVKFTTLFPIDSMAIQAVFIFLSLTIGSMIGVILGWILGPLLLVIHATMIRKKNIYDLKPSPETSGFGGYGRAFYPSLMAISIAMTFATMPDVKVWLLDPTWAASKSGIIAWPFVTLIILLVFTIIIATGIFSGVWLLLETGLIYQTKDAQDTSLGPPEIRSVGGWYRSIFGGYAGVGAIIGFYSFALVTLSTEVHFSVPALLIPMPLILLVLSGPALVIYDMTREQRIKKLVELARKYMKNQDMNEGFT